MKMNFDQTHPQKHDRYAIYEQATKTKRESHGLSITDRLNGDCAFLLKMVEQRLAANNMRENDDQEVILYVSYNEF